MRNFHFRIDSGAIKEFEVIDFLKALLRHIKPPLLIVWGRLPAQRSRLVGEFVELSAGRIATEHLPPYAPELAARWNTSGLIGSSTSCPTSARKTAGG